MSAQKLIDKLERERIAPNVCYTQHDENYNRGINQAIDLIKSHDFGEPNESKGKMKLTKDQLFYKLWVYEPEDKSKLIPYRMLIPEIVDLISEVEIVPVPQESEEVRAIEAEIEEVKKDAVVDFKGMTTWNNQQAKLNHIWTLEQRLKEAKGK